MTKRILTFSVLACLALGSASCEKLQARDKLNKGVNAFKAQRYDAAIENFKRAIELDPELKQAELYLATGYAQQFVPGNPSEENQKNADLAVKAFQGVLAKDPGNKTALAGVASIYQANMQYEKARQAYMEYAKLDPQNHLPLYGVGSVNWYIVRNKESQLSPEDKSKLIEEGLQYLDKSLAINPDYEDALWYVNLLLREKAILIEANIKTTKDKNLQKELTTQSMDLYAKADEWSTKAMAARKKNADKKTATGGVDPNK